MIGLIFGETDFPMQVLNKIKNQKKYLIIDLTKSKKFKKDKNSHAVSLGQFGKIISILKNKKCKKVLFAGKVKKPKFSKLRLDLKGAYYIPRIIKSAKLGDAAILKEIINILKKEQISTISSLFFNPELTLKKGNFTKLKPDKKDRIDIKKAVNTLHKLDKYNFTQGTVVRNNKIIAIEGIGGTQQMLKKCKNKIFKKKGVLVKLPKKRQDLRIDLPSVGLKTLTDCKSAGLKGIVLKSRQNIFLDRIKCINFANKNKMFIMAI
jgi:UDP-2,3-diacylglucosamine hydrolase